MKFKKIVMNDLYLAGFTEYNTGENNRESSTEFSSWGEEDDVCPYCGEVHDIVTHYELNWEDNYPAHSLLKKNIDNILSNFNNLSEPDKKYEVVTFGDSINDIPGYNMVGVSVKDLNLIPAHFIGMRFPKREYKYVSLTMGEFMNSIEMERSVNYDEFDNFLIIEYSLNDNSKFSDLKIKVYYPLKV